MARPLVASKKCSRAQSTATATVSPARAVDRAPKRPMQTGASGWLSKATRSSSSCGSSVTWTAGVHREVDHVIRAERLDQHDGRLETLVGWVIGHKRRIVQFSGRMPTMTSPPIRSARPGYFRGGVRNAQSRATESIMILVPVARDVHLKQVHCRRADERGDEGVGRLVVDAVRRYRSAAARRRSSAPHDRPWSWPRPGRASRRSVVTFRRPWIWAISERICTRSLASRLDSGSSIRNTDGLADDGPAHGDALALAAGKIPRAAPR